MAKTEADYRAEWEASASAALDTYPDLGWRIEPESFGPRGAVYFWRIVDYVNARVIRESSTRAMLTGFVSGVRWAREHREGA